MFGSLALATKKSSPRMVTIACWLSHPNVSKRPIWMQLGKISCQILNHQTSREFSLVKSFHGECGDSHTKVPFWGNSKKNSSRLLLCKVCLFPSFSVFSSWKAVYYKIIAPKSRWVGLHNCPPPNVFRGISNKLGPVYTPWNWRKVRTSHQFLPKKDSNFHFPHFFRCKVSFRQGMLPVSSLIPWFPCSENFASSV